MNVLANELSLYLMTHFLIFPRSQHPHDPPLHFWGPIVVPSPTSSMHISID